MNKNKKIAMLFLIIASLIGALLLTNCAADLQGTSAKADLYKIECLDYGKVNTITTASENVLGDVPGYVDSITFKPIANPSAKIEITKGSAQTALEYLGNLTWKLDIKAAVFNKFKIKVTAEDGTVKEYNFRVEMNLTVESFSVLSNGTTAGYLKYEKAGVVSNSAYDVSVSVVAPTIKVDLSSDITNLNFITKFKHTGNSVKIADSATPSNPTITLVSEETNINFSTPVTRSLKVYGKDNTNKEYKIFVGRENTTEYSDEAIVNKIAVVDKNTAVAIALVNSDTDNAYIAGTSNFRNTQLNDTTAYANDKAALMAGAVKMFKAPGMFRGKYIRIYPLVKPSDSSKYKLDMLIVKSAVLTGDATTDILVSGAPPYQDAKIAYGTAGGEQKVFVSLDFLLADADYIVPPPIYLRGRPTNLMWDAMPKAELYEAVGDPEYTGKYSIMRTRTFTCVEDPGDYTVTDSNDDYISNSGASGWDWKIGEGVVPNAWLYFAFHFGKAGDDVVFSSSTCHTSKTGRGWAQTEAGESKTNWNNKFTVGKKYTWYIKDYLKGSAAQIMVIEE